MSIETRIYVANNLLYQDKARHKLQFTQRNAQGQYLIDTDLVGAFHWMLKQGLHIVVTSLYRPPSGPQRWQTPANLSKHGQGKAADFWLCDSPNPIDYLDPDNAQFARNMKLMVNNPHVKAFGLGGAALHPNYIRLFGLDDPTNPNFRDDPGADHIHMQVD